IYPREAADYRHDEITRAELPLVAVEILSPSQSHQEVVEKAEIYLRNGMKSCWIVSPPLRTVAVLLPDEREEVFHSGVVKDPVVGLTADLTRFFSYGGTAATELRLTFTKKHRSRELRISLTSVHI